MNFSLMNYYKKEFTYRTLMNMVLDLYFSLMKKE